MNLTDHVHQLKLLIIFTGLDHDPKFSQGPLKDAFINRQKKMSGEHDSPIPDCCLVEALDNLVGHG